MSDVLIIGGGASGLAAAIEAARGGCSVTVLEQKERPAKKILVTGNGRCNLTNLHMDPETCYRGGDPGFIASVLETVSVKETLAWFGDLGIPTKDRNGYVYPRSDQASAVAEALILEAEHLGVEIVCGVRAESIRPEGPESGAGGFLVEAAETGRKDSGAGGKALEAGGKAAGADGKTGGKTARAGGKAAGAAGKAAEAAGTAGKKAARRYRGRCLILSAGSKAAPATGSDGSGYGLAESLGHRVADPLPALVQLVCRGRVFRQLAGIRTEAEVSLLVDGKAAACDRGEVQLTDYGISGIPVFQVSRFASSALHEGRKTEAKLDLLPGQTREEVLSFLQRRRDRLSYRTGEQFLSGLFAGKLGCVLLSAAGISLTDQAGQIPDRKLERLADQIKGFPAEVSGTKSFEQAQICCGGVLLEQVERTTMESKLHPGLYLTGELLDADGICGGYNLQWAWSTGILAGRSAAAQIRRESPASVEEHL